VACLACAAWTLWFLGYPDQALQRVHDALNLAQELAHPLSVALALQFAAGLHQYRRESQAARERAEVKITLSREQGFPYWLATGIILRGWALAEQGQRAEGIAHMHQGVAAFRATGSEIGLPWFLALLAEAYGKGGQTEEGLNTVTEALAHAPAHGEHLCEAELYRLQGTLTLHSRVQGLQSTVE
jgi:predicted ATPase